MRLRQKSYSHGSKSGGTCTEAGPTWHRRRQDLRARDATNTRVAFPQLWNNIANEEGAQLPSSRIVHIWIGQLWMILLGWGRVVPSATRWFR